MPNHTYINVWCKDFSEATFLQRLGQFLSTVPLSSSARGFTEFVIRAITPAETPVIDRDLRPAPADAAGIVEMAAEHLHADSSYEVQTTWDLWTRGTPEAPWQLLPQPLEIHCRGEEYDDSVWSNSGHFQVDAGLEHLFTGHGGLLGFGRAPLSTPQSAVEADFLAAMSQPKNLGVYHEKTRENIRKLYNWMQTVEQVLPVDRWRIWSEGEENLEARLEEILAVR